MYKVTFNTEAHKDLRLLQKKAPNALPKLAKLLEELKMHPRSGTGQCERLKHYEEEVWSRRITKEHRLVYAIHDDKIEVLIVSAYGHY